MQNSFLQKIICNSDDISQEEYFYFLRMILDNKIDKCEVISFMSALSAKPLNLNDILCFVRFVESISPRKRVINSDQAINIVGTGGGLSTFNISTAAAFVASTAGAKVLKSGSYSYNSQSGSLDVLQALGINTNLDTSGMEQMLEETGIGFVNPNMYSFLLRRLAISILPLKLKTIGRFVNTIGPLICPVQVKGQITGVSDLSTFELMSKAMSTLKLHNSIVVWAEIGLDEFSSFGKCHVANIGNAIQKRVIEPKQHGFHLNDVSNLRGGTPSYNAEFIRAIFQNKVKNEARDIVILNSAYLLIQAEVVDNIRDGIDFSLEVLISGKVSKQLEKSIAFTNAHTNKDKLS